MKLYHGTHTGRIDHAAHLGLCLTDDLEIATRYAGTKGTVFAADVDVSDAVEVAGYDHDSNTAPGDELEDCGADVITFGDEDECGRQHQTYRLMSAAAVEGCALVLVRYTDSDACPCEDGCDLCCY